YRYTLDKGWLKNNGYPFMKECIVFLSDILKKGDDGLYHAFPSNQGEDGFNGEPDNYRDCRQVMEHIRYGFMVAINAAELSDEDGKLVNEWKEMLDNLAPPQGGKWPGYEGSLLKRFQLSPPEFGSVHSLYGGGQNTRAGKTETFSESQERCGSNFGEWYFGATIQRHLLCRIRGGENWSETTDKRSTNVFDPDLDFEYFRRLLLRWRHENGLYAGMSVMNHGHTGHWTEALGVTAPLQEMLLQSWDGAIAVFPCWPLDIPAEFTDFRAEGAFLVSASCGDNASTRGGKINNVSVKSLEGGYCSIYPPWPEFYVICEGKTASLSIDDAGRPRFETEKGKSYALYPRLC
ncbi:MAG: hypothetical protein FWF08_05115, partial [Oscillospiraceae bacterium]|nr:hypothetical protein [Oscillospiraceae bacterium]